MCVSQCKFFYKAVMKSLVNVFVMLRKPQSLVCLFVFVNDVSTFKSVNTSPLHLKHFEVLVWQFDKSKCLRVAKRYAILTFLQSFAFTIHHPYFVLCFFMCSYNKLEDDFESESDPLRAYNDYLEDVENIGKSYVIIRYILNTLLSKVSRSCVLKMSSVR